MFFFVPAHLTPAKRSALASNCTSLHKMPLSEATGFNLSLASLAIIPSQIQEQGNVFPSVLRTSLRRCFRYFAARFRASHFFDWIMFFFVPAIGRDDFAQPASARFQTSSSCVLCDANSHQCIRRKCWREGGALRLLTILAMAEEVWDSWLLGFLD